MKMIFMGRKSYAANMLKWTIKQGIEVIGVVTDSHLHNSPTVEMANEFHIPIMSYEDVENNFKNDKNYADIVISFLFWKIIKEPLISSPKLGCINLHPAILPDYRGLAGYNIAILNQLEKWGATAHYVSPKIDEGDIIKVFEFNFDPRCETAYSLEKKTLKLQEDLYKNIILDLLEGKELNRIPQNRNDGIYINKKQMLDMMKVNEDDDIETKIQAFWFPPYSGAYIEIKGKQYTLVNDFILNSLADKDQTFQK